MFLFPSSILVCRIEYDTLIFVSRSGTVKLQLQEARIMQGAPRVVQSCLHQNRKGMTRALMEVISSGTVSRPDEIGRYARCTLLAATHAEKDFKVGHLRFLLTSVSLMPIHQSKTTQEI